MPVRWLPLTMLLAGCPQSDDTTTNTDSGIPTDTAVTDTETTPTVDLDGTAGALQDLLREVGDSFAGYGDAAARLLDAYNGGTPEGVKLSAPAATRSGSVSVDYDLDGTYDEDLDVTIFTDSPGGDVQVFLSSGYYRAVNASRNISVVLSTDETGVNASNTTIDVYDRGLSFHGSGGMFRFATVPTGEDAGSMSYVAYTAEPNSIISGVVTVTADSAARYTVEVSYMDGSVGRAASGFFSEPLDCGTSIKLVLKAYCSQGPTPANVLLPAALVAFLLRRRR